METRTPQTKDKTAAHRQRVRRAELASVTLLIVSGACTTWCGFQSSLWNGVQSTKYAIAAGQRVESTRHSAKANLANDLDLATFVAWTQAFAVGNTLLEEFYRLRFRAEFRPAFDEWLAMTPLKNPKAPASPFALPSYRVEEAQVAAELSKQAEEIFAVGRAAKATADSYGLITVLFALVLVFAGLVQQVRRPRAQTAMLGMALGLLLLGLINIALLPRASWPGVFAREAASQP
jgi:hypothetical protein